MMFTYAVIKRDGIDDHEPIEIIFVWYVIAVPCDHVKRTVTLIGHKQLSLIFTYDLVIDLAILVPSHRRLKISRIRQTVRSCTLAQLISSIIEETWIYRIFLMEEIQLFNNNIATLFSNNFISKIKYEKFQLSLVSRELEIGLVFFFELLQKYLATFTINSANRITYWSQFRQLEMIVEDLEDITSGWAEDGHGESHTLLNDTYLVRLALHLTELSGDLQSAQLWHCNRYRNLTYILFSFEKRSRLPIVTYRWENRHRRCRKLYSSWKRCINTRAPQYPDASWDRRHRTECEDLP